DDVRGEDDAVGDAELRGRPFERGRRLRYRGEGISHDFIAYLFAGDQPLNIVSGKMNTADEAAVPRLRRCLGKAAKAALRRGSRQRIVVRVVRIRIGSRAERDVIGTKEIRE